MCYLEVARYRSTWHHIYTSRSSYHGVLKKMLTNMIVSLELWLPVMRWSVNARSPKTSSPYAYTSHYEHVRSWFISSGLKQAHGQQTNWRGRHVCELLPPSYSTCPRPLLGWWLRSWISINSLVGIRSGPLYKIGTASHWNKFGAASCTKRTSRRTIM